MQRMTIRINDPDELAGLIKDLRNLRRNALNRGGTRRTTYAGVRGNTVVFEVDFGLQSPEPKEADRTEKPVQRGLFD